MLNQRTKALIAGLFGNAIEWYDFALYGHFSVIIGQTFFPKENPELAMLSAFAIFSVSFFMRPLGAYIFSLIGDRYGRRRALYLSMMGMALPTAGIGLLPGFQHWGIASTIILTLIRLLQGFALGGEMGGAITYVMENAPPHRKGLISSLIQSSTCLGLLLGSLISSLISQLLPEEQFLSWGWRLPFIIGLLAAWIGLFIRRKIPESTAFEQAKTKNQILQKPIHVLLHNHWRELVIGTMILIPMTCTFFLTFVYYNSWMITKINFSVGQALSITSLGLIAAIMTTLLGGLASDKFGAPFVLCNGILLLSLSIIPLLKNLTEANNSATILPWFLFLSALVGFYTSAAFGALSSLFATAIRYSGVSFAINIASPIFGSTLPLLATWLNQNMGDSLGVTYLSYYLVACFALACLGIIKLPKADQLSELATAE